LTFTNDYFILLLYVDESVVDLTGSQQKSKLGHAVFAKKVNAKSLNPKKEMTSMLRPILFSIYFFHQI
jgi:hypothetical protein